MAGEQSNISVSPMVRLAFLARTMHRALMGEANPFMPMMQNVGSIDSPSDAAIGVAMVKAGHSIYNEQVPEKIGVYAKLPGERFNHAENATFTDKVSRSIKVAEWAPEVGFGVDSGFYDGTVTVGDLRHLEENIAEQVGHAFGTYMATAAAGRRGLENNATGFFNPEEASNNVNTSSHADYFQKNDDYKLINKVNPLDEPVHVGASWESAADFLNARNPKDADGPQHSSGTASANTKFSWDHLRFIGTYLKKAKNRYNSGLPIEPARIAYYGENGMRMMSDATCYTMAVSPEVWEAARDGNDGQFAAGQRELINVLGEKASLINGEKIMYQGALVYPNEKIVRYQRNGVTVARNMIFGKRSMRVAWMNYDLAKVSGSGQVFGISPWQWKRDKEISFPFGVTFTKTGRNDGAIAFWKMQCGIDKSRFDFGEWGERDCVLAYDCVE